MTIFAPPLASCHRSARRRSLPHDDHIASYPATVFAYEPDLLCTPTVSVRKGFIPIFSGRMARGPRCRTPTLSPIGRVIGSVAELAPRAECLAIAQTGCTSPARRQLVKVLVDPAGPRRRKVSVYQKSKMAWAVRSAWENQRVDPRPVRCQQLEVRRGGNRRRKQGKGGRTPAIEICRRRRACGKDRSIRRSIWSTAAGGAFGCDDVRVQAQCRAAEAANSATAS